MIGLDIVKERLKIIIKGNALVGFTCEDTVYKIKDCDVHKC